MKTFLQDLDPMKMYFYQSDYDAFAKYKDQLADMAQQGDISFAYLVYNTFLDRIDERVKMVDQILASPQDFTVDEELVTDKDAVTYAKTPEEAYDRWRKRIKYDLLLLKAEKADSKTDKSEGKTPEQRLEKRYHSFAKRMRQTDAEELLEMYLTSLTTAFDPHTTYMSPSSVENFKIMMQLKLEGIGASLQGVDGYTVVKKIIPGGAAEKEGHLKLDDKIIGVGEGESGELVDVVDMKLNDVVKMIRGKPGTVVRLQLTSVKDPKPHEIKITRAKIELKDSEARGEIFDAGRRADGKPYKIGVINLPSFYMDMDGARQGKAEFKSTTRDVHRILRGLQAEGRRRRGPGPPHQRRRLADRGHQPDRPVHQRRARGPGQGRRRPGDALLRSRSGHRLERPAGRGHQQVQRQCQRDFRRGHPGLQPRPDRGRQVDPRQGHGAKPLEPGRAVVPHCQRPQHGRIEDHDAAVLPARRRQHAAPRRGLGHRVAVVEHAPKTWARPTWTIPCLSTRCRPSPSRSSIG